MHITSGGGMNRLQLGPYASRSDADKVAEKIRTALGYKPTVVIR
jgi:rare lipoprotein A